jgi:hypothetical protein
LNPADTLIVVIEAAAALAGFAAIVATLRKDRWTELDGLYITNLLSTAFSALFLSMLALVLMHASISESSTWVILSLTWFAVGTIAVLYNFRVYRKLEPLRPKSRFGGVATFWFVTALLALALQVANVLSLREFWPVLVGILWLFGLTCHSFWRLIVRHHNS